MNTQIVITMSPEELGQMIQQHVKKAISEENEKADQNKTYSITGAAKKLNRHFSTVKKLVAAGKLECTADGQRITELSIKKYLNNDRKK